MKRPLPLVLIFLVAGLLIYWLSYQESANQESENIQHVPSSPQDTYTLNKYEDAKVEIKKEESLRKHDKKPEQNLAQAEINDTPTFWEKKLCEQEEGTETCVIKEEVDISEAIMTDEGNMRGRPTNIILQSSNFSEILRNMRGEVYTSEVHQSEAEFSQFLAKHFGHYPSSMIDLACNQQLCLMEVDVDAETNVQELSDIVYSGQWPQGTVVMLAPVYSGNRLKLRIATNTQDEPEASLVL